MRPARQADKVTPPGASGTIGPGPFRRAFFTPAFDMCVDQFGALWIIAAAQPEGQS